MATTVTIMSSILSSDRWVHLSLVTGLWLSQAVITVQHQVIKTHASRSAVPTLITITPILWVVEDRQKSGEKACPDLTEIHEPLLGVISGFLMRPQPQLAGFCGSAAAPVTYQYRCCGHGGPRAPSASPTRKLLPKPFLLLFLSPNPSHIARAVTCAQSTLLNCTAKHENCGCLNSKWKGSGDLCRTDGVYSHWAQMCRTNSRGRTITWVTGD